MLNFEVRAKAYKIGIYRDIDILRLAEYENITTCEELTEYLDESYRENINVHMLLRRAKRRKAMRENRIIVYYADGEYMPTDEELTTWAKQLLLKMVAWKGNAGETTYSRESREDYNKHAAYVIDTLLRHFDFFALEEFLTEECKDDLEDYFEEAHEREIAENREQTLGELENEEYARTVYGGLR